MDTYIWIVYLLTMMTGSMVWGASYFSVLSSSNCNKELVIDKSGTTIKWARVPLTNCKIDLTKKDVGGQICVKMNTINLENSRNEVKFHDNWLSSLKTWNYNSPASSVNEPTCTHQYTPYIVINTVYSDHGSFELEVYISDDDLTNVARSTVLTIGVIIGIVVGVIFLIIIVLVVIVCCCCMKSRRSTGTVYNPPATTPTVLTNQQQMATKDQYQDSSVQSGTHQSTDKSPEYYI